MRQILLQVPDEMLRQLEKIAPGSSRKRSRFVQLAIQKALMEVADVATREAYAALPDDEGDALDPSDWSEWAPRPRPRPAKAKGVRRQRSK